jgi:hypothetical protein
LESRQRIGLYGSGEVPRSRRLTSRAVGPKSNGLRDLGDLAPIRRIRPTRMVRKTVAAATIASLASVIVIVTAFALATSLAPVQTIRDTQKAPPPPYSLIGYTFGPDGFTPIVNAVVTITDTNTGAVLNAVSDPDFGIIIDPLTSNYPNLNDLAGGVTDGDEIVVYATEGALSGSNSGIVDTAQASLDLNVVLSNVIPEFSGVVLPVVGMIGMFAIVGVAARSRKAQ